MRVRITNSVGDPIHTKIIDDETGTELKNATGILIFPFDTDSKEIRAEITTRVSSLDVVAEASLCAHCPHCNQKLKILDYVDMLKYLPKGTKLEIKDDTITAYWDKDADIEWSRIGKSPIEIGEEKISEQKMFPDKAEKAEFINWLKTGKQPETYRNWEEPSSEAVQKMNRMGIDVPMQSNITSHYDETTGVMTYTWTED